MYKTLSSVKTRLTHTAGSLMFGPEWHDMSGLGFTESVFLIHHTFNGAFKNKILKFRFNFFLTYWTNHVLSGLVPFEAKV